MIDSKGLVTFSGLALDLLIRPLFHSLMEKNMEICYICGYKIDPDAKGDLELCRHHIIPRSKGGGRGDIRIVHRMCHYLKGADGEYIRLQVRIAMRDEEDYKKRQKIRDESEMAQERKVLGHLFSEKD